MLNKLKSYFTLKFHYKSFYDHIGGNDVNMYVDCFGDMYLKDGRWSTFSVFKGNISDNK